MLSLSLLNSPGCASVTCRRRASPCVCSLKLQCQPFTWYKAPLWWTQCFFGGLLRVPTVTVVPQQFKTFIKTHKKMSSLNCGDQASSPTANTGIPLSYIIRWVGLSIYVKRVKECTKRKQKVETKSRGSNCNKDIAQQVSSLPTSLFSQHPFLPIDGRGGETRPDVFRPISALFTLFSEKEIHICSKWV